MNKMFYKRSTAILFVALTLILVLLVCMLLVTLMQMSSLNARADKLNQLIEAAKEDESRLNELKEYLQSDEYVKKWAVENGRVQQEDIVWVEQHISQQSN